MKLEITQGASLQVTVNQTAAGAGTITAQVMSDTTEKQLIKALRAVRQFNNICRVGQITGGGSAVVATLALAALGSQPESPGPRDGLLQWLESKLALLGWDDRDLVATGQSVGLIFAHDTSPETVSVSRGDPDRWRGMFQVCIAFHLDRNRFHEQNALLDLFREHLYYAVKVFTHPALIDGVEDGNSPSEVYGFHNALAPKAAGTVKDQADLRVVGTFNVLYEQPPYELTDLTSYDLNEFRLGIFRNLLDEEPGGPGAELDDTLVLAQS